MRSTRLQSFTILHHSLDGVGVDSSSEALGLTLDSNDNRQCQHLTGEVLIDANHLARLSDCLLLGGMCRVALLPEELSRTEEETRTHLPAHYVSPLITE